MVPKCMLCFCIALFCDLLLYITVHIYLLIYRQEAIEQLLGNMFDGEHNESVIVNGIQVLLTLLEPRRPR